MRSAILLAALGVLAIGALFVLQRLRSHRRQDGGGTAALRRAVLTREAFKDAAPISAGSARAVVFDWHVGNGVATLVAFDDGTTSLYLSSGGGVIGAGAHEVVRRAAQAFRDEASSVISQFQTVDDYPLPAEDHATFYVITENATLSSRAIRSSDLRESGHPLHTLAQHAQTVISAIRQSE